jgi:hypothetical protein
MSISTILSSTRTPSIVKQLLGESPIDPESVVFFEDYSDVYRIRHDLIHGAVCDKLGLRFGEIAVEEVLQSNIIALSRNQYFDLVKKQTPDFMGVKGNEVTMVEITVSTDLKAKNRKSAKYALLCKVLQDVGYVVNYKIFAFDPRNIYVNHHELITDGLDDLVLDFASKVCANTSHLLREVHRTFEGRLFYQRYFEILDQPVPLNFFSEDVLNTHETLPNKCFHSTQDLKEVLFSEPEISLDYDDNDFINNMLKKAKETHSELISLEEFHPDKFISDVSSRSNSNTLRSVLPLPFITNKMIDSSIRSTEHDWFLVSKMASKMEDCNDSVLSSIGQACSWKMNELGKRSDKKNEDFLFACKLSDVDRALNALEGPERKKFLKLGSQKHLEAEKEFNNYCLDYNIDVSDVESCSFALSEKPRVHSTNSIFDDMRILSEMSGLGLSYVSVCQSIYREININSMRGDRRNKYIIKPTGVEGVFICLFPGTKLRCGELANIVWFKILIDNEHMELDVKEPPSWMFKRLHRDRFIHYTRWLSCDVHRLDHYIRCYDKILMAYTSVLSQRYRTDWVKPMDEEKQEPIKESLISKINEDNTNLLGLIILTYMEDKRSTSKMLQNVRYLVMTSISLFPKYKSVFEKFKEPIRSPLQLYYLKKMIEYFYSMADWNIVQNTTFGKVQYDYKSHTFLDINGGSIIKLPRPLVSSRHKTADFAEILSEMYFTMLFNKNQDDPTHASFQILDKIIEGEDNFIEVKKEGNHLGYKPDVSDTDFANFIIDNPKSHQFSKKAIEVSSRLLREKLDDPFGDQIKLAIQRNNINKTLDEFATFKSSSTLETKKYNHQKNRQNPRVRCLEGVNRLLAEGIHRSFEVIEKYKLEETYYHVFKKNQIGGVREILILPITNRIRINVLESISRNICHFDKREVLTHGVTKNESVKSALYMSKKYENPRAPLHLTFDKSKWGPSFVPIQFLYLFTPFKKILGPLYFFIVDLLIRHQNKDCVLPDRLVKAWWFDEDNKHKHQFSGLQHLKEKFLVDGGLTYKNESNMGQGILHYTSSLLHLQMVTFRDELYSRWCKDAGLNSIDHEDLLSSDDSYTIFCPELVQGERTKVVKLKLNMFLRCQQVSEYLFNCRTSKVKSSINPLIGEFNSLFISNLTFIPTLFKFCLSSVHPLNTDSFYRMVKESYSSSRQITENGGGMDLYLLSHYLNKRYCEEIYHTYAGGVNSLLPEITKIPYHLGYYPIFNPALMICFGPEYYNYKLYTQFDTLNEREQILFISSHKIVKGGLVETMAEFEEGDTILGGLMRIEAKMGPIEQLNRIRASALMSREELQSMVIENPILILDRPKSVADTIFKVTHKLYTTGSKEALKNIAASIYYGRVSATVSANAFYIPNGNIESKTYRECLETMLEEKIDYVNFDQHMRFLYPKYVDYDIFVNNDEFKLQLFIRNPLEIQTIQTLVTHKIYTKLTQPVVDLLMFKWGLKKVPDHLQSKVERDMILIKHHFPLIKDTIEETKNQFSSDGGDDNRTKSLLMLMLKLFSLRDRKFKGVLFGYGSNDIIRTYETLLERNYSNSLSAELKIDVDTVRRMQSYEKIYCAHNYTILSEFAETKLQDTMWSEISEEELMIFFQDPSINKNIKKRIFMCAISNGYIDNVEDWSVRVGVILHYWHRKQKRLDDGSYVGNFDVTFYMGHQKLNCYFDQKK